MDGPGRPSLYRPEFAEQAFELCLAGATNLDLADTFEVGHSTIDNWLQKHPEFAQAVKRGGALADGKVAHGLYSRAIGYTYEATRVVLCKGEPVVLPHTVHKPPDVRAGIFWLRNRRPDQWGDRWRDDPGRCRTREWTGAPSTRRPGGRVLPPRPKLQDKLGEVCLGAWTIAGTAPMKGRAPGEARQSSSADTGGATARRAVRSRSRWNTTYSIGITKMPNTRRGDHAAEHRRADRAAAERRRRLRR